MAPTMTIGGAEFVEAPEQCPSGDAESICTGCHFFSAADPWRACDEPMAAATAAFGGDCIERHVIYIAAPTRAEGPGAVCTEPGPAPACPIDSTPISQPARAAEGYSRPGVDLAPGP